MDHFRLGVWMRQHRAQAMLRGLWLAFVFVFGTVVGAGLAWGPLTIEPPLSYWVGLAAGLLFAGLWVWQQRAAITGQAQAARRWRAGLILVPLAGLLAFGGISAKQMIDAGAWPMPGKDRLGAFDRLWRAVRDNYPYFDLKGVDWNEVYARYRPQVEAAQTDDAYFGAIAYMLAELNDGHTELSSPWPEMACYGDLVEIEGLAVVNRLGVAAQAAGLARGDVVHTVNGRTIDEAIAQLDPRLRDGSTPWQRRSTALFYLLCMAPDQPVALEIETASGERREVTLTPASTPPSPQATPADPVKPLVTSERLPSGFWLIRMPVFANRDGHNIEHEFFRVMQVLDDAPGIILDLRGNGGGNTTVAEGVAMHFLGEEPVTYIRQTFRQALPLRGWRTDTYWQVGPFIAYTSGSVPYDNPVVLIIDGTNASSAEDFIVSLVDSGRAKTVGRVTGGMSGNPIRMELPGGGVARYSTGDIRRMDGRRIEGAGIAPDVTVTWTLADFRAGRDLDVEAAAKLLQEMAAQP